MQLDSTSDLNTVSQHGGHLENAIHNGGFKCRGENALSYDDITKC